MFEDGFSPEELSPLCGLTSATEEGLGMFDLDFFRNESLWCAFPNVVTGASTFWDVTVRPAVSSVNPTTTLRTNKKKINLVVAVGLFTKLPDELIIAILSYLNVHELLTVGLVSKTFSALSKDDQIWRGLCSGRWGQEILNITQRSEGSRSCRRKVHWKSIFRDRLSVEENWRMGNCSVSTIPYSSEITCIQLDDKRIATGSYDTSVKIWNLFNPELESQPVCPMEEKGESSPLEEKTVQPLRSLEGHAHRVYCLQFKDNRLISGSDDTTMKLWDIDKSECLHTLTGHTRPIRCLQFNDENVLVSGSYDKTVRVWDMEKQLTVRVLDGYQWCVCCLKFDDRIIITGSLNKITMWDKNSGKPIGELEGHTNWITSLQFDDAKVISGSMDNTIKIWDLRTRACVNTLADHQKRVRCVQYDNMKLCSGSYDHSVKIWDWRTGHCWVTLYGHTASARCLHFNSTHLVTGSLDKSIKIWDFSNTGTVH